jgi:hypothetical protein
MTVHTALHPIAHLRKRNRDLKRRETEAKRAKVSICRDGRGRIVMWQ